MPEQRCANPTDLVLVFSKPNKPEVADVAPALIEWLTHRGFRIQIDDYTAEALPNSAGIERFTGASADNRARLAIVLGGDGTLLRVVRLLRGTGVPLLGVNLGTLGFLTELATPELFASLEAIFDQRCVSDCRTLVEATLFRNGVVIARFDALNDAVVSKGSLARVIEFDVSIDGIAVTHFRADGVIVSTPTGSTAYSLSAGGPILYPSLDALILTPICPHTLTNRPLIVRDTSLIEITMRTVAEQTFLTIDGQSGHQLAIGDRIVCRKSPSTVALVRLPQRSFFDILRSKLKWG